MSSSVAHPSPPSASPISHVLVVGGNGYVGSAVCRSALRHGLLVTSLSRTGADPYNADETQASSLTEKQLRQRDWVTKVRWMKGDVLQKDESWTQLLQPTLGATSRTSSWSRSLSPAPSATTNSSPPIDSVVSCVGGFGSVDTMRRINGDANINVFEVAAGNPRIKRVGFVSAFPIPLPGFLKKGYYEGKHAVEAKLQQLYPPTTTTTITNTTAQSSSSNTNTNTNIGSAAIIVQPGFLYGPRYLPSMNLHLPLQVIFGPLNVLTNNSLVQSIRQIPILTYVLTPLLLPPIHVDRVADILIKKMIDTNTPTGVTTLDVPTLLKES